MKSPKADPFKTAITRDATKALDAIMRNAANAFAGSPRKGATLLRQYRAGDIKRTSATWAFVAMIHPIAEARQALVEYTITGI